ncbi:hypothetical protein AAFF_G00086030 [Aldrovandia affinis]|uniref:Uncharacterized protein n=1 Tax=Aldrovandia affinis TaxID=143900 RepID=A0AAD7R231_9TELE|nr:hypothetical protein AAFF_G00086030 [Aldrovandia affinis]
MSPHKRIKDAGILEVSFVGDAEVLDHIVDKQEDVKVVKSLVQKLVTLKSPKENLGDEGDEEVFDEQNYVEVLGTGTEEGAGPGSTPGGAAVFTFQTIKHSNKMAQMDRNPIEHLWEVLD